MGKRKVCSGWSGQDGGPGHMVRTTPGPAGAQNPELEDLGGGAKAWKPLGNERFFRAGAASESKTICSVKGSQLRPACGRTSNRSYTECLHAPGFFRTELHAGPNTPCRTETKFGSTQSHSASYRTKVRFGAESLRAVSHLTLQTLVISRSRL